MNQNSIEHLQSLGLAPASPVSLGVSAGEITPASEANTQALLTKSTATIASIKASIVTHLPLKKSLEYGLVVLVVAISLLVHGFNMRQFPYYENDEGTYVSQAWSVLTSGSLSPYTYWYDHAPAGWMFISLWAKAVGGFFTFGTSVDTGRVFMLVLHGLSTLLVYGITKRLTKGKVFAGILAALVFSLSPLAIYFQRRVLLDNMMVFWLLLSLWTLLRPQLKLRQAVLSALFFGIAVLTKETAVFFIPAFVYAAWIGLHAKHRMFGLSMWVTVSGLVVSLYPMYALLKSELFPQSWFGSAPHVSLLETLSFQASRGSGLPFWNGNSEFYVNAVEWFTRDPFLMVGMGVGIIASLALAYRVKNLRIPLIATLGMLFFLMRGGLIINFYILPLIPFAAILLGMVLELFALEFAKLFVRISWARDIRIMYVGGTVVLAWALALGILTHAGGLFTVDETTPMKQAIAWTKENLNSNNTLIIDNAIFVDVRESRFAGDKAFPHAEWFWKVEKDPDVYKNRLGGDWLNVDYVLLSHEMVRQTGDYQIDRLKDILPNSKLVTGWTDGGAYIDLSHYISTNGDWMRVYKVDSHDDYALNSLWNADKASNVHSYGQVIDEQGNTTASLQGQAMLRAVLAGDKAGFNGLWSWTHDHLQHRPDGLVSQAWGAKAGIEQVTNNEAYLEANQDIALALVLAGRTWNNGEYSTAGSMLVNNMWANLAVNAKGKTVLAESTKKDVRGSVLVNPGVYAPAHYRVFSQVDGAHAWSTVANEAYASLPTPATPTAQTFTVTKSGAVSGKSTVQVAIPSLVFKVALDAQWFGTTEAKQYLVTAQPTLEQLAKTTNSAENSAALLAALSVTDPSKAVAQYGQLPAAFFNRSTLNWSTEASWSTKTNLWLTLTLYAKDSKVPQLASQTAVKKVSAAR